MRHVIGFGNPLHGDDGFGPAVCELLQRLDLAPDVRVFDAGTRGLDALALLSGCGEAIMLDACAPAGQPGLVSEPEPEAVLRESGMPGHAGGVGQLLRALAALEPNPPKIRVITAEALALRPFHPGLSAPMARAVAQVAALLEVELRGAGTMTPD